MHCRRGLVILGAILLSTLCTTGAFADPVIVGGSTTNVASGGVAIGSSANYDFFGGNQPSNLTNVTFTLGDGSNYPGNGSYSTLQVPGGGSLFTTGVEYYGTGSSGNGATLTFGTFSTTLSSFTVYILTGNADPVGYVYDTAVGLSANGGDIVSESVPVVAGTNNFTAFNVTGVTSTDVFTLYATGTEDGDETDMGGIVFGPASLSATPEPASLSLVLTGMGACAELVRRRRLVVAQG
jgi:hypothetical protein